MKHEINEQDFCRELLGRVPLKCEGDRLYSVEGPLGDRDAAQIIYDALGEQVTVNVALKVGQLLRTLKLECGQEELPLQKDRIHLANGTYYLKKPEGAHSHFSPHKEICRNRLPVHYDPYARTPVVWYSFLQDLLENEEDIKTLQEYMGYCLIPSTDAQKMLVLSGRGGEGKSVVGQVLYHLLGESMNTGSIHKLEKNDFARADLEGKLLLVDDDADLELLKKTSWIKALVTAQRKLDVERKGVQSYQARLYSRFLCLSNGNLLAAYDNSDAFLRRQLILRCRERPADRVDEPRLSDFLLLEREGILLWCLEGLQRLKKNNWVFTISESALKNLVDARRESQAIDEFFLHSEGYLCRDPDSRMSSRRLYQLFCDYCEDNGLGKWPEKVFFNELRANRKRYNLMESRKISVNGRCVRGYIGIRECAPYER